MFENFIDDKIRSEKDKVKDAEIRSTADVKRTTLLPAVKKFIVRQAPPDLSITDLNFLLEKAVKLNFNYTIRPKWTLMKYLFNNYDSQRVNNILEKMEVFLYYRFYTDLIAKFIDESAQLFVTSKQVEELITETNSVLYEKLIGNISGVKVKNFFIQLFRLKYDSDSAINLDSTIPFIYIKIFLEDKGYHDLLSKFTSRVAYQDEELISLKDIIKTLTGKSEAPAEITEERIEETPSETFIPPVVEEKFEEEKPVEVEIKEEPTEEILEDRIVIDVEEKTVSDVIAPEPEIIKPAEMYSTDLIEAGNIKEEKEEAENKLPTLTIGESVSEEGGSEIKNLFTVNELNGISKEIYRNSRHKMYDSIDELDKMESWDKAAEYLKKIFIENDVDPYEKIVLLYVDILNEYFLKKEKV